MEMKSVWIDTDERYPDYSVYFTECHTGRKVQMTKKQVSLVRRYEIILSQYETMCKQLYDSNVE